MADDEQARDALTDLEGRWEGRGEGYYPTIAPFSYREQLTFTRLAGKPVVEYRQRTWDERSGQPMHAEVGYLRAVSDREVELVLAQPTGVAEVASGLVVADGWVELRGTAHPTPTAKRVDEVVRRLRREGDVLVTELSMSAMGQPLTGHLRSHLDRADPAE